MGRAGRVLKGIVGVCAKVSDLETAERGAAFSQGVPKWTLGLGVTPWQPLCTQASG